MTYDLAKHSHNFAAWCAATAARRGLNLNGKKQGVLIGALEATDLPQLLSRPVAAWPATAEAFDRHHATWRRAIVQHLQGQGIQATHGRAAKLTAVYIKSRVIVGGADSAFASIAHPPVDRLLLQGLHRAVRQPAHEQVRWQSTTWTSLTEQDYESLIKSLRKIAGGQPLWTLERYWDPKADDA